MIFNKSIEAQKYYNLAKVARENGKLQDKLERQERNIAKQKAEVQRQQEQVRKAKAKVEREKGKKQTIENRKAFAEAKLADAIQDLKK